MEKLDCKYCDKVIEGYTKNHVEFLMKQHMLTHRKDEIKEEKDDMKEDSYNDHSKTNEKEVKENGNN